MRPKIDFSPLQYGWKPLLSSLAMLVAGLSLTAASVFLTRQGVQDTALRTFSQYGDRIEAAVQTQFRQPLYGIRGAIGAQASTDLFGEMKRANFRAYVATRDIASEFPGIRGFGYIERVMRPDMARFEAAQKADQAPYFSIKTRGNAPELYVVKYMEPVTGNTPALGLDLGSEPVRREAIERAINTGEPSLSGVIQLAQDGQKGAGFLYLVPVFSDGTTPDTPQARRKQLVGLFDASLTARELLHNTLSVAHGDVDFELYDGATPSPQTLVFSSQQALDDSAHHLTPTNFKAERAFSEVRGLIIGGRLLTLRTGSATLFDDDLDTTTPRLVGAGGVALSLLLATIAWLLLIGRARAETLAQSRTADLGLLVSAQKATNEHLSRAIRESKSLMEAIDQHAMLSITDLAGTITHVNDLFCTTSGYSREELVGKNHRIVNSGVQPTEFWKAMWETITAGQVWRNVACNRAKDGALFWVNTVIAPLFNDHGVERFIAIRTDITAARNTELALSAERERLSNIIMGTRTGTWEWNVQTDALVINERWADILGYTLPSGGIHGS